MSTWCLQLVPSAYTRTGLELSRSAEEDGDPGTGCGAFSRTVSSAVADTTGTPAGLEGAIAVVTLPCLRALTMPPTRVRIRCNHNFCPCQLRVRVPVNSGERLARVRLPIGFSPK